MGEEKVSEKGLRCLDYPAVPPWQVFSPDPGHQALVQLPRDPERQLSNLGLSGLRLLGFDHRRQESPVLGLRRALDHLRLGPSRGSGQQQVLYLGPGRWLRGSLVLGHLLVPLVLLVFGHLLVLLAYL